MLSFDPADVFRIVGPIELAVALLVGIQAGATYAWHQRLGTRLYHTVVLSGMFFIAMLIARGTLGSENWESWLGLWLLYVVFAIGIDGGYRGRSRVEKRRLGRSKSRSSASTLGTSTRGSDRA